MIYAMATKPYPNLSSPLIRVRDSGPTLTYADGPNSGRVVSCQPDGTLDSRDAGTAGDYELCAKAGGFAGYDPSPADSPMYLFTLTQIRG